MRKCTTQIREVRNFIKHVFYTFKVKIVVTWLSISSSEFGAPREESVIVNRFSYLGSWMTKDGSTLLEVNTRASNGLAAYAGL